MDINSVIFKKVLVINGREHVVSSQDWTQTIIEAVSDGTEMTNDNDVIEYVKSEE